MSSELSLLLTSVASKKDADSISRSLVKNRLAACVSQIPTIKSVYIWEENIEEQTEILLLIKTTKSALEECRKWLEENHSYSTPEILILSPENANKLYVNWANSVVKP